MLNACSGLVEIWCFALVETGAGAVRAARQQRNIKQQSCRWPLLSLLFLVATNKVELCRIFFRSDLIRELAVADLG